ncbi:cysteine proteinase [Aureobasidium sp. EXF-12298]|nr:cysteine proteinase [Aureobasidium sp. EXF-12298]KAI4761132.1 cysteine proteinase [Aureobasidium sp. EXF-12344]KAI4783249.1 cysteine proteinase [Aureobasidium sp. EXF-3400]
MQKTIRRRNNNVAATYVENALKRRTIQAFRNLSSSPCAHCRKDALRKFLDLKRRLQKMDRITQARARSLPPSLPSTRKAIVTPVIQQPVSRQLSQPPSQPVQEPSKLSKKRRISESEPPDAKPQQQSKKPRKHEEESSKKPEVQSQKQSGRQSPLDGAPKPGAQSKGSKQEPISTKPLKGEQSSSTGKPLKSPTAPASNISKSWPSSVGKPKIKGLSNPSQWCYRRSVLQSLIATPHLFNLLDECHKSCPKQGRCVTCAMRQLLLSYHTSPGGVGTQLAALDSAIRATGRSSDPRWSATGQTQEDSHDFLQYLLNTFEKAKGVDKDQFASLFRIKHKISWVCGDCKKVHTHSDPASVSLSVPIPDRPTVNLTDCLNTYHREPNVTIRCDKCKKNTKRTRIFQIDNAPDVLPIQLMRFGYGARGPTKNKKHVDFPEELDLSPWTVDKSKPSKYRLQAIVAHSGSLKFGHYIAYVKGADGVKEISDSSVSNSNAKEWRRPTSGFNPYILVYIKQ